MNDTRKYDKDHVPDTARFFIQCYGKEIALKLVSSNIRLEEKNPIAEEYWSEVYNKINETV